MTRLALAKAACALALVYPVSQQLCTPPLSDIAIDQFSARVPETCPLPAGCSYVEEPVVTPPVDSPAEPSLVSDETRIAFLKKIRRTHRFVTKLGQGAYGEVYLMETTRSGRRVVCKVQYDIADYDCELMYREVVTMKKLRKYKHVATYLSHRHVGDHFVIFMAYANEGSIYSRMNRGKRLSQQDAKKILFELALGMAACEKEGVLHRDIKPENILINNGKVWLTDFGIGYDGPVAPFEFPVQTEYYRAPEVHFKKSHSSKADVWSFGVTAVYALSGVLINPEPFLFQDLTALIKTEIFDGEMDSELEELFRSIFTLSDSKRISAAGLVNSRYFSELRESGEYDQAIKQIFGRRK